MGSEWQTVQSSKSKGKAKAGKGLDSHANGHANNASNAVRPSDPAGAVLAQIDADWNHSRSFATKQGTPPANGLGAYDTLEVTSKTRMRMPAMPASCCLMFRSATLRGIWAMQHHCTMQSIGLLRYGAAPILM